MHSIRHGLLVVGLLLIAGCGTKVVKKTETDTKLVVPEYVINAKELLGIPLKESKAKVRATTDFFGSMTIHTSYVWPDYEYGRTTPYFTEALFDPAETYTLTHKAYLTLREKLHGSRVGTDRINPLRCCVCCRSSHDARI